MLGDPFPHLPSEIEAGKCRVLAFQQVHDTQGLGIVLESAFGLHHLAQRPLTGVAERRMAKIVHAADGLSEIEIQTKAPRHGERDLGDLFGMREAGTIVLAFGGDKYLRLVAKPPVGG